MIWRPFDSYFCCSFRSAGAVAWQSSQPEVHQRKRTTLPRRSFISSLREPSQPSSSSAGAGRPMSSRPSLCSSFARAQGGEGCHHGTDQLSTLHAGYDTPCGGPLWRTPRPASCVCQVLQKGPVIFPAGSVAGCFDWAESSSGNQRRYRLAIYFSVELVDDQWYSLVALLFANSNARQRLLGELVGLTIFGEFHDAYRAVR